MRRWPEVVAILVVLAVAVIVPPLLPRTGADPMRGVMVGRAVPAVAMPVATGPLQAPDLTVTVNGEAIETVQGSFCWSNGPSTACGEAPDLTALAVQAGVSAVASPEATVQVRFSMTPLDGGLGVNLLGVDGAVNVELDAEGSFKAPSAPGRYLYELSGKWPQGYANYGFLIEVADGRLQPPPISVKVDGQSVWTVRGGACWQVDGEVLCTDNLSPAEQLKALPAAVRAWGAKIEVSFAAAPERFEVYLVTAEGRKPVDLAEDGSLPLTPERPGRYVYEVDATWPQGSGTYGFQVEVK